MSRALKSDKLKTKKQETEVLPSDVVRNTSVILKKDNASRVINTSTYLNDRTSLTDEKKRNKTKLSNETNGTSNARLGGHGHRTQLQRNITGNSEAKKLVSRKANSVSQQKHVPLRAKQLPSTSKADTSQKHLSSTTTTRKIVKKPVVKKPNSVLDTPHNVTVCSPPPKKRNGNSKVVSGDGQNSDNFELTRKGSRTLDPDEVVVLKRESAKLRSEENIRKDNLKTTGLKESVAFEVNFKKNPIRELSISHEKVNTIDGVDARDKKDKDPNYSDDFESYESDFESESDSSSTQSKDVSEILVEKYENCGKVSEEIESHDDFSHQLKSDESEHEDKDDSEVAQNTITEIQRYKERKLDSGHYDMNSRKTNDSKSSDISVQFTQPLTDSLETFNQGISEQLDSGISTYATSIPASSNKNIMETSYGGYKDFYAKPIVNQRGSELMTKVQFDILSFTLIDLKPIAYDIFMQTFGKLNTSQNFTQTEDNQMNEEQQTEVQEIRSIWTQHPAIFDQGVFRNLDQNGTHNQRCCGEIMNNECQVEFPSHCDLEKSIDALKKLNNQSSKRNYQNYQMQQRRPINYEHLNSFLLRSSLLIDQILGSSNTNATNNPVLNSAHEKNHALNRVCEKSFYMETNILNSLRVIKIFSNNSYNLLITVHESLPDTNVYSSDFSNLLMVWCTTTCNKPLRLLTTWSQVSKVEISNDSPDIIVAALRDGSIAIWDLRETHSFCSKLDGYLTHFAATQSIIPSWSVETNDYKLNIDLGACLDVKSFRNQSNKMLIQTTFPKTQFVSLHDSGIVTVWTLVETSEMSFDVSQIEKYKKLKYSLKPTYAFDYTSPWARVKLMQSTIVNIKEYLEKKSHPSQSRFDKTKTFFQKNIYSDEALRELNDCILEVGQQGLRFSSLECGSQNLFICTNRNYILMCSKTLKMDKLKRITINESQFLFPTALKVLSNENFLAVGLSNGVVMILNCQSDKVIQTDKISEKTSFLETIATDRDSTLDDNNITGKSCAIQNILLNVKKSYKDVDFNQEYRPSTAACITLIESKKKPFELRVLDQQVILSGSVLRKNLIQSLELSSDGWYLFSLANGHIRIYDFYLEQELCYEEPQESGKIIDIATGKCGNRESNLMILKPNTEVEVHILRK